MKTRAVFKKICEDNIVVAYRREMPCYQISRCIHYWIASKIRSSRDYTNLIRGCRLYEWLSTFSDKHAFAVFVIVRY